MSNKDKLFERKRKRKIPARLAERYRAECPFCGVDTDKAHYCDVCGVWFELPKLIPQGPPGTHAPEIAEVV